MSSRMQYYGPVSLYLEKVMRHLGRRFKHDERQTAVESYKLCLHPAEVAKDLRKHMCQYCWRPWYSRRVNGVYCDCIPF